MNWHPYRVARLLDGEQEICKRDIFIGALEIQYNDMRFERVDDEDGKPITDNEGNYFFKRMSPQSEKFIQNEWIPENYGPEAEAKNAERIQLAKSKAKTGGRKFTGKVDSRQGKPPVEQRA